MSLRPARSWFPILSLSLSLSLSLAALSACAIGADDDESEAIGPATAETANNGSTTGELRVRAGEVTLWVDRAIKLHIDPEEHELVATIKCRTSRNLVDARSWVPDDAFGTTTIVGPRSFEITLLGGHEINTVLSGLPLFVAIDVTTGSPRHYEARIDLELGLGKFTGTASAWVDASLRPLYAGGPDEPLRYRVGVDTASPTLTVEGQGAPEVAPAADGFTVDWNYPDVESHFTDGVRVGFRLADGSSKTAAFEVRTSRIGLTTEGPTVVWPSGVCAPEVFECVGTADDLATCGSYREVAPCVGADPCEAVGWSSLVLNPLDLEFVWASARAGYVAGCGSGGQWCSIQTMQAYTVPECLLEPATIEAIVTRALGNDQDWGGDPFARGTVLDRAGLVASPLFGASYSPGGPALFNAIDAHMGGGAVEGWHLVQEVPCPNCTDFADAYVLWYPDAFRVIVIEAGHGYDS